MAAYEAGLWASRDEPVPDRGPSTLTFKPVKDSSSVS
jgi:hypothetical protein